MRGRVDYALTPPLFQAGHGALSLDRRIEYDLNSCRGDPNARQPKRSAKDKS